MAVAYQPHQLRRAPLGMNTEQDAPSLPEDRARSIKGFFAGRDGRLHTPNYWQKLLPTIQPLYTHLDGVAWYRNPYPLNATDIGAGRYWKDKLLVMTDAGDLYAHSVSYLGNTFWLRLGPASFVGYLGPFGSDPNLGRSFVQPFRTVQYLDELIIVREGGMAPKRFYQDATGAMFLRNVGMTAPVAVTYNADSATGLTGTYQYVDTYVDDHGRESSPSTPSVAHTVANKTINSVHTNSTDPQTAFINVYRIVNGGSVFYSVTQLTNNTAGGTQTYADSNADATIQLNDSAPLAGANDAPHRASLCAIHRDRLWLNDLNITVNTSDYTSPFRVQISNLNFATQFNSVVDTDNPGLGTNMRIGEDLGDEITGLHSFNVMVGSQYFSDLMGIWKRNSYFIVIGDAPVDFSGGSAFAIRQLPNPGCVAPDSIAVCANGNVAYLAKDGVWLMASDAINAMPLYREIASKFTGYTEGSVFA